MNLLTRMTSPAQLLLAKRPQAPSLVMITGIVDGLDVRDLATGLSTARTLAGDWILEPVRSCRHEPHSAEV
ncbi:hypothetical protein ACIQPR_18960 [Streptomyces sp. NPDC091280]|uniref:hypothetical protein n=1 Tax=Streptomyces sp. NPDC091280 TaxID=3365984 RepID=UPI00380AF733